MVKRLSGKTWSSRGPIARDQSDDGVHSATRSADGSKNTFQLISSPDGRSSADHVVKSECGCRSESRELLRSIEYMCLMSVVACVQRVSTENSTSLLRNGTTPKRAPHERCRQCRRDRSYTTLTVYYTHHVPSPEPLGRSPECVWTPATSSWACTVKNKDLEKGQLRRLGVHDQRHVMRKRRHVCIRTSYKLLIGTYGDPQPLHWSAQARSEYQLNLGMY